MLPTAEDLAALLWDARKRTLALIDDLADEQLLGPRLAIVNPLLWETGHVGWFQEYWTLRNLHGQPSILDGSDALYDSAHVAHDTRWDLPLPSRPETIAYLDAVLDRVIDRLQSETMTDAIAYFHRLAIFHEDMHAEAVTYTRQTLAWPRPANAGETITEDSSGPLPGDAEIPGGRFLLGAVGDEPFVFDNEKWAHEIEIEPFRMSRAAVTNGEFAEFVDAGGYDREEYWSEEGWAWRMREKASQPFYWRHAEGGGWQQRRWNEWSALREHHPIIHVNAHEAEAYCSWAHRRLPTEAEWELAACGGSSDGGKRRFPWGDDPPTEAHANLDARRGGVVEVAACEKGENAFGCRQMIGNVWEWTSTRFLPYPAFIADPYKEYSEPWFHTPHRVLRGGAWTTRGRLLRNTWRNFYEPHRRDVFGGFRTCAR